MRHESAGCRARGTSGALGTVDRWESGVRSYCRSFPVVFRRAKGSWLEDVSGRRYLDFFAGAGALNYGHNHPELQAALAEYVASDGVTHSLDLATEAKCRFLERFAETVLRPRRLDWRVQFPGPTGTNAVEAALKLARKVKGRDGVLSFTNAFHGMTLGSLAVTGNGMKRGGAGVPLGNAAAMPFEGFLGDGVDTVRVLETFLEEGSSGVDLPAAVIVETIQAEGGVRVASETWLRRLREVTRRHDVLLVLDDVQVGCGRTGPFFSFEPSGVEPDIVCLSKAISGYGLPMALVLFRPELDVWSPGEHNGTFRGNNHAFVTATRALELFWRDDALTRDVDRKAAVTERRLRAMAARFDDARATWRGRGLIQGLDFGAADLASDVSRECFDRGMVIETSGSRGQVLKLLPPLTVTHDELHQGLDTIEAALERVLLTRTRTAAARTPDVVPAGSVA